jgi:hypothetical protein
MSLSSHLDELGDLNHKRPISHSLSASLTLKKHEQYVDFI